VKRVVQSAFKGVQIFEVEDSDALLRLMTERAWDLILMDILMPGLGMTETLTRIRTVHAKVPILIFTGLTELEHVAAAMAAGANGVIHKNQASGDLVAAIQVVTSGGVFLHPEIAAALEARDGERDQTQPHMKLSAREAEIFRMIAMGRPLKEIAKDLGISEKTVVTYLTRIRGKTGLNSYVEIARYALQNRLVQ
jgi:DNA-binding NarL/FixJ family response regulator